MESIINFDESNIGKFFKNIQETKEFPEPNSLRKIIFDEIVDNSDDLTELKQKFENFSSKKPVCAKILKKEPSVRCLDCQKDQTCVICIECYENSDHKGHKIIFNKMSEGCCDCGDPEAWEEKGFCKNHAGYAKFKLDKNDVDNIPQEFRDKFHSTFTKIFYHLFSLVHWAYQNELEEEDILNKTLDSIINILIEVIELGSITTLLICNFLQSTLPADNNNLYHKCDNLQYEYLKYDEFFMEKVQPCQCTFLENLFRYNTSFSKKIQNELANFLIMLFIDYEFKKYIGETYLKMINFIFPIYIKNNKIKHNDNSKLFTLCVQLFTSEEFALMAVKSKNLSLIFDFLEKLISICDKKRINELAYYFFQIFEFMIQKKSSRIEVISTPKFMYKWFDFIDSVFYYIKINENDKHADTDIGLGTTLNIIDLEEKLLRFLDVEFKELSIMPQEDQKLSLCREYGACLKKQILEIPGKFNGTIDQYRSLSIPTLKAYALFMKNFIGEYTQVQTLNTFYTDIMGLSEDELKSFNEIVFKYTLRTYGFAKEIEHDGYGSDNLLKELKRMYYLPMLLQLDCELLLLQTSILYINPSNLYSLFSENFSTNESYKKLIYANEDINGIDDENEYKMVSGLIEEYGNLLVNLMINDFHYALLASSVEKYFENEQKNESFEHYFEEILINVLQTTTRTDYKNLRKQLDSKLIFTNIKIDNALANVASFDQKTKTFELKNEFKNIFDVFILNRDQTSQYELEETLKKKSNIEIDLIAGNGSKAYKCEKESILYEVQKRLNSCETLLNKILFFILKSEHFGNNVRNTLKPLLKFADINHNISSKDSQVIRMKLLKAQLNILNKLRTNQNLTEFQVSINKLIQRIITEENTSQMDIEIGSENTKKEEDSKSKAKKKMLEIQNQFKKKQMDALSKINIQGEKIEIENEEVKNDDTMYTCTICHEKIDSTSEKFGLPGLIHTDNVYDIALAKALEDNSGVINENDNKDKPKLWDRIHEINKLRVVDNMKLIYCEHPIHLACHEKNKRSSIKNNMFCSNNLEFACSLCKALRNTIIQLTQLEDKNIPKSSLNEDILEKDKVHIGKVLDALDNLRKMVVKIDESPCSFPMLDEEFFNNLLAVQILSKHNENESDPAITTVYNENSILELLDSLVDYNVKCVEMYSIKHFICNSLKGLKFIIQNYTYFYKTYDSKTKDEESKQKINKLFELLSHALGKNQSTTSPKQLQIEEINQSYASFLSLDLNQHFFEYLQRLMIYYPSVSKDLIKHCVRLYLTHKIFQYTIIPNKIEEDITIEKLEEMINDKKLLSDLIPTYKKILAFLLINVSNLQDKIVLNDLEGKSDEQIIMVMIENISELSFLKVEIIIKDIILNSKDKQEQTYDHVIDLNLINNWRITLSEDRLNHGLKHFEFIQQSMITRTFDFIKLPDNYYDLSMHYNQSCCELCKSIPKLQTVCICLICGFIACVPACKVLSGHEGNLNQHSNLYHCGMSLYLDLESTMVFMINSPKNIDYLYLYENKFGQHLKDKTQDWKAYHLNLELYEKLKEITVSGKIPQEIYYSISKK